jgi:hypothetical protein
MDLVFQRISYPWSKTFNTQPTEKQKTQRDFSHWNFIQCCSTLHCLPFFGKPSADKGKKLKCHDKKLPLLPTCKNKQQLNLVLRLKIKDVITHGISGSNGFSGC